MATNKIKRGTLIHGVAASEHLDSSGERILIDGLDVSKLEEEGVFNYEHSNSSPTQIVGKITKVKKIFKKEDCENDAQLYFWNKLKVPFVYVMGELFDHVGHSGAQDIAAMLKYDDLNKNTFKKEKKRPLINFSIEGAIIEKDGGLIKKALAKKVTITITPCNKMALAEIYKNNNQSNDEDNDKIADLIESIVKDGESHKKAYKSDNYLFHTGGELRKYVEEGEEVNKAANPPTPKGYKVKVFNSWKDVPERIRLPKKTVIRIKPPPRPKTGVEIYGKPPKQKPPWKKSANKIYKFLNLESGEITVKKALTADMPNTAPSNLSGGAALQKENLMKRKKKKRVKKSEEIYDIPLEFLAKTLESHYKIPSNSRIAKILSQAIAVWYQNCYFDKSKGSQS